MDVLEDKYIGIQLRISIVKRSGGKPPGGVSPGYHDKHRILLCFKGMVNEERWEMCVMCLKSVNVNAAGGVSRKQDMTRLTK